MSRAVGTRIENARDELTLALRQLRGLPVEGPDEQDAAESPDFSGDLQGIFMVGEASAKPGEVATVEVLGATNFETRGLALGIGVDPAVKLVGHDSAPELEEILNIDAPQTIIKQQDGPGNDWYTEFVQCGVVFYQTLGDVLGQDPSDPTIPKRPKRTIVDVVIPRFTPILTLKFMVPADKQPGDTIELSLEHVYGQRLRSSGPIKKINWDNMYATRREVKQTGVYPPVGRRISGTITVA